MGPDDSFDAVRAIADAILYEGYLLYPYRRSSGKNRVRWQFGVLVPPVWAQVRGLNGAGVAGSAESWRQQTECLLEPAGETAIELRIRFLHQQRRQVLRRADDGTLSPVDSLQDGPRLELSFDEAVPREFDVRTSAAELLAGEKRVAVTVPAGEEREPLPGGQVLIERAALRATAVVSATPCETPFPLLRLRCRIENDDPSTPADATREEALRASLLSCHTLLAVRGGAFVSLLDPPRWAEAAARDCVNEGAFPVLAGEPGSRDVVLSSPIILYDHPRVAPESPGDLHDATEIDEILSLRTLTLTDAEKREARATDPRAAEIIDRVESMPPAALSRLHGTIRAARPSAGPGSVTVAGVEVSKGSRVRLRPRLTGTDPQDMFLTGRTGLVEDVLLDVDDTLHLAVTVEDDPGADLHRWYGRYRYFTPDEIEPLEAS
ncbi:hypothetical protein [Nonomuraea sp. WAC 01424]|uniref:hypothetical protein n=1 Tax=Nonomuraea sp. WAC 01424 TaxID=2203200 RepID=UPI0021ADABC7|nr:hypothetical protein [Nonomuraea sp. WAC 01424]